MINGYDDLAFIFSLDLKKKYCLEIAFHLQSSEKFSHCWMGKMRKEATASQDLYWFGLEAAGLETDDYDSFEDMANAPVFDGACLKDICHMLDIDEINDIPPEEYLHSL